MIEMMCYNCGRPFRVADQAAGRRIRCPKCQTVLQVTAPDTPKPEQPDETDVLEALRRAAENEGGASTNPAPSDDDLPASSAVKPVQQSPLRVNATARADGFDLDSKARLEGSAPTYESVELAPRARKFRRQAIVLCVVFGAALFICITIAIRFTSSGGRSQSINVGANQGATSGSSFARHLPPMPNELRAYADSLIADKNIQVELNLIADSSVPTFFSPIAQHDVAFSNIHVIDGQGEEWNSADFGTKSLGIIEPKLFSILKGRGLLPYDPRRERATDKPLQRLTVTLRINPVFQNFIVRRRMDTNPAGSKLPYDFRDQFHFVPGGNLTGERWQIDPSGSAGVPEPLLAGLSICIESARLDLQNGSYPLGGDLMPVCRTAAPKQVAMVELTGGAAKDSSPISVSGKIQYTDLALSAPANEIAEILSNIIGNPSLAWAMLWSGTPMDPAELSAGIKFIFAMSGSDCVATLLAQDAECLAPDRLSALTAVLEAPDCRAEWLRPFLKVSESFQIIAVQQLALKNDAQSAELFRQYLSQPEGRSPELLEAAACALINLKQNCPELSTAIQHGTVKSFKNVTNPARAIALDVESARIILSALFEDGTTTQRASAAAIMCASADFSNSAALDCLEDIDASDSQLVQAVCGALAEVGLPPRYELFHVLAGQFLETGRAGEVPMVVVAVEPADTPKFTQRYPQTVAGFICRRLIQSDSQSATPLLLSLSSASGICTRISALEALLAGDCVDAAPGLRERFLALTERGNNLDTVERQELEILRSKEFTRFCRYEVQLVSIKNLIVNGRISEARQTAEKIAAEKPGTEVAARALKLIGSP